MELKTKFWETDYHPTYEFKHGLHVEIDIKTDVALDKIRRVVVLAVKEVERIVKAMEKLKQYY